MIRLRTMADADRATVAGLRVTNDQLAFVDTIADTLNGSAHQRENYVIEAGNAIVGFFQVDSGSGAQAVPDSIELHEVQIDAAHQGNGHAGAFMAALAPFLAAHYPDTDTVSLTVNCRNRIAYRVYAQGGFTDTGALYHGGRSGPQHVMTMKLR